MGCDIHLYTEHKLKNGTWESSDRFRLNRYVEFDNKQYEFISLYDDRNYALFGILANVRNYYCSIPISERKGFPHDCCEFIKKEYEDWKDDCHSTNWYTYNELIKYYNQHKTTKYSGLISPDAQKKLDSEGIKPTTWCQGTSMKGFEFREWEEESPLEYLIELIKRRMNEEFFIFNESDYEKYGDNFRIVFWFDS